MLGTHSLAVNGEKYNRTQGPLFPILSVSHLKGDLFQTGVFQTAKNRRITQFNQDIGRKCPRSALLGY